ALPILALAEPVAGQPRMPIALSLLDLEEIVLGGGLDRAGCLACRGNADNRDGPIGAGKPVERRQMRMAMQDQFRALPRDHVPEPAHPDQPAMERSAAQRR